MLDLNSKYFHFIGGYNNININKNITKLNSILGNGYILSREKQLSLLKNDFSNSGNNWNGDKFISICKIGKCDDNYESDYENAYDLFCYNGAISIILNEDVIYSNKRRNYWHMQGEVQIKDMINSEYFSGVGLQFNSYYDLLLNKYTNKEKLEILKKDVNLYQKVLEITNKYNINLYALNNGENALSYLNKEKTMIK